MREEETVVIESTKKGLERLSQMSGAEKISSIYGI